MRSLVTILLTLSLIATPLRASSGDCCCQRSNGAAEASEPHAASSCCSTRDAQQDDAPKAPTAPTDKPGGCKCPSRCCTPLPAFACIPLPARAISPPSAAPDPATPVALRRGEDHLDRLKRPPRA
ncbi:MAG: hypothetical protein RIB60_08110 [Phycisphaerales bacterium]